MQIMITHGTLAQSRVVQFRRWQLIAAGLFMALLLMLCSGAIYHFVFLKAAREGWPVVSQLVKLVVRDEIAQRERYMRENLDAMAQRVGEMQAKVVRLEALGERISGLAGVKPEELKPLQAPTSPAAGQGGPFIPMGQPTLQELQDAIGHLEARTELGGDIFALVESRLFEARLQALLVPNTAPVEGPIGSGFGFRSDPFTGRPALHAGLDFPAEVGTAISAAAGGVVITARNHPTYGNLVEIDHGSGLATRYGHASKLLVNEGDLVKRGQKVAEVGSTGRSTGPHLHFEVLVDGVPQNPARFLAQSGKGR